jgi:hypothetical protein
MYHSFNNYNRNSQQNCMKDLQDFLLKAVHLQYDLRQIPKILSLNSLFYRNGTFYIIFIYGFRYNRKNTM